MKKYIGTKMVEAEPAFRLDGEVHPIEMIDMLLDEEKERAEEGYELRYPDGYISWSPKEVFERAYMKLDENKDLPSGVSVGEKMVNDFIAIIDTRTIGDRTTVVMCTLRNGFIITESSSCVDPANYSQKIGEEICMGKIKDKIWELLGFLLQTAVNGIQ